MISSPSGNRRPSNRLQLQNFDRRQFLDRYWQRQPLLIKNALPGFENPLSADELAGLALEPEVESRLVLQSASGWELLHGPFSETDFNRDGAWSLLVQAVDHYSENVARLWQLLDFLPHWRRDDVMVSYATDGGSVGPHYDNYDVFLLQGLGQRRWRLGQQCSGKDARLPHDSLQLLADFQASDEYLLDPGDILYLPPRLAHWGEAITGCMTYSLGFRAPRLNQLLSRWLDDHLQQMDSELFYTDPPLLEDAGTAEISVAAAQRALALVQEQLADMARNSRWLGELVTEPRYPIDPPESGASALQADCLRLEPAARLAWSVNTESRHGASVTVYANGVSLDSNRSCLPLLRALSQQRVISREQMQTLAAGTEALELLAQLERSGCIYGE